MRVDLDFLDGDSLYQRVIRDTVLAARSAVWIATANVKDCQIEVEGRFASIVVAFAALCTRGVEVRLLHSGIPSASFLASLRQARLPAHRNFAMRRCQRLHFKAALVDDERLYLGSANLTGAGLGAKSARRRNFELGILTTDAALIERVARLYHEIWEGHRCADCQRTNVCYVPLEDPAREARRV